MKFNHLLIFILIFSSSLTKGQTNLFPNPGKVGIGTTSPGTALSVKFSEVENWISDFDNTGPSGHKMYFGYNNHNNISLGLLISGGRSQYDQLDFGIDNKFYIMGNGDMHLSKTTLNIRDKNGEAYFGLQAATDGGNNQKITIGSMGAAAGNKTGSIHFYTSNTEAMRVTSAGNIGIGYANPEHKLVVNGTIKATKIKVSVSGWSDYVFDSSYSLRPLNDLAQFIRVNKHLPEIPNAREVEAKGIDVGDVQALLLKKVEELTLYILKQEERINRQEAIILRLEKAGKKRL